MPRGENRPSVLLSREENEQVFAMIGLKCQSLSTAVVQLFTTEGPAHGEWKKRDTGVLCLIKDNQRRSYFFRLYCLHRKSMIWEHEVYVQIEYKSPRPYLHTFEAEEYMTAFNFANEDEATTLCDILNKKIEERKQRRKDRARSRMSHSVRSSYGSSARLPPPAASHPRHNGAPPPTPALFNSHKPASTLTALAPVVKSSGKKDKPKRYTKADIGMPQDFVHVSHIGWDEQKGFDVENVPEEEMKDFFRMAGVSETQLQDQATRDFIYTFINEHGGVRTVIKEVHDTKHRKLDPKHSGHRAPAPPPVPTRSSAALPTPPTRAPAAPPARAVPPPPHSVPAPAPPRNPPPPRPSQPPSSGPPMMPPPPPPPLPPSTSAGGAPPPPPPPPPSDPAACRAPPSPVRPDPRADLMNSIRKGGVSLKHVDTTRKPANIVEDGRGDLLKQIREGTKLKPVERDDAGEPTRPPSGKQLLADQLADALRIRMNVMQPSDSDSTPTDSEGEWDD